MFAIFSSKDFFRFPFTKGSQCKVSLHIKPFCLHAFLLGKVKLPTPSGGFSLFLPFGLPSLCKSLFPRLFPAFVPQSFHSFLHTGSLSIPIIPFLSPFLPLEYVLHVHFSFLSPTLRYSLPPFLPLLICLSSFILSSHPSLCVCVCVCVCISVPSG